MKKLALLILVLIPAIAFSQYKQASSMTSGKKQITTTVYDKGYVILNTGEKIEGLIQLKVVNTDTAEIRMKMPDKSKKKYSRYDVSEFGLARSGADLAGKEKKNKVKNLQSGYIIMANGDKKEGKVAMRNNDDAVVQAFAKAKVLFENSEGIATTYSPEDLKLAVQNIDGDKVIHESYKSLFVQRIGTGSLIFMRNPFPTTKNVFASALAESAASEVNDEIARQSFKAGADLKDIKENHDSFSSQEVNVYQKEYLVKRGEQGTLEIVTKKTYKNWSSKIFGGCNMDKEYSKYAKIEEALAYYNINCVQ